MRYLYILFIGTILVGCAQTEISVPVSPVSDVAVAVPAGSDDAKSSDKPVVTPTAESTNEVIIESLVDWGFAPAERKQSAIDTVIIHSVYNPFIRENRHSLEDILEIFEDYGVSPHYIIDREGAVHRTVREKDIAWHAGRSRTPDGRVNVNDFSLGIEMVNALGDTYTDMQYKALKELLEDIQVRYDIKYILGHDEIEVEDPWDFDWDRLDLENRLAE